MPSHSGARPGGMKFRPVPPALADRFLASLPDVPGVERRKMFGCPCAFVNGNMFASLHEDRLIVRVPEEAPARPFVAQGRTMREYAALEDALALSPAAFRQWIDRGFRYASGLPPRSVRRRRG